MIHLVMVLVVIRTARVISPLKANYEPLVFLFLHDKPAAPTNTGALNTDKPLRKSTSKSHITNHESTSNYAITLATEPTELPKINWEYEAELTAKNNATNAAANSNFRDLSGLSAEQLQWVRNNHMQQMSSDFAWDHRTRDNGNPLGLFWINEYCVIVVMIPFCRWGGKIVPNGDLFKHMHDPVNQ